MATPSSPPSPKQTKAGPNFPKSQNGTSVKQATVSGNRAIPATHCTAKRAASNVRSGY